MHYLKVDLIVNCLFVLGISFETFKADWQDSLKNGDYFDLDLFKKCYFQD